MGDVSQPTTSKLRSRLVQRALAGVTVIVLSGAVTVGLAVPAQAWADSGNVVLDGLASCKAAPLALDVPARSIWVHVASTGETVERPVDYRVAYWKSEITIPPQGSQVDFRIFCSVPGVGSEWRVARSKFVNRPWFGRTVDAGLVRA